MTYRICSISGGGVKGVIPVSIIKEMLGISKKLGGEGKITDICDHVVGTSVGGIIGAGLVVTEELATSKDKAKERNEKQAKFTVDQVVDILKNNGEEIFPQNANDNTHLAIAIGVGIAAFGMGFFLPTIGTIAAKGAINAVFHTNLATTSLLGLWPTGSLATAIGGAFGSAAYKYSHFMDGLFSPKYTRDGIDKLLNDYFGDLKLSDVIIPFTTVSFSLDQDKPRIWSTFRADKTVPDDFYIKDALGATSAAPTFLPLKHTKAIQGDFYDIDGGIFSNSPLNLAISVLNRYATDDIRNKVLKEGISVISIGTGHENLSKFTPPSLMKQGGLFSVIGLLSKTMSATEKDSLAQANYSYNFMRLDPLLDKKLVVEMDNPGNIPELLSMAENFNTREHNIIESYVKCLYYKGGFGSQDTCSELQVIDSQEYAFDTYELLND